ncbi:MAG: sigma-70 family RNA polymerase sigma factor [Gemmatimonadaceae bacterium]
MPASWAFEQGQRMGGMAAARDDLEALFLAHRDLISRIALASGRRQGLRRDDLEDFVSWATSRLIERDYAVLAQFRGESALATYLTVVVTMLARDYRVQHWGRWRPSATARRQGPLAVRLETLVYRDGVSLAEAAQALRTAGITALSDRDLAAMLASFPRRSSARLGGPNAESDATVIEALPGDLAADDGLKAEEADAERRSVGSVLSEAVDGLPAEDGVMVRLRYWQGLSVADVARALDVPQKPLYRRLERALVALRAELERRGVDREQVRALLGEQLPVHAGIDALLTDDAPPGGLTIARNAAPRPPPSRDSEPAHPSMPMPSREIPAATDWASERTSRNDPETSP